MICLFRIAGPLYVRQSLAPHIYSFINNFTKPKLRIERGSISIFNRVTIILFSQYCHCHCAIPCNLLMNAQEKQLSADNQFEKINQSHKSRDLTYFDLIWNTSDNHFLQEHHFAMDNWEVFAPFSEKALQSFQDIAAKRLLMQSKEIVFPAIDNFLQHAETINEYKGNKKRIDADIPHTDRLYQYYIEGLSGKVKRHGVLHLIAEDGVTRIPLDDYIANCKDYKQSESKDGRWQRILKKTNQQLGQSSEVEEEMMSEFLSEIERERLPSLECIGCSPFFYSNTNIYAPGINSTPIIPLPSIAKIKELEGRLKDEVCWLLNNNGGIILFDCATRNRDIIPIGITMSPTLKGEYEQKVISYILGIYPLIKAQNYSISFVPIVKNPLQSRKKEQRRKVMEGSTYESTWNERQYIEEVYVMRIKVEPTMGERLYFWINDSKPIFPLKISSKITFTPCKNIRKAIKRRFKDYYVPQDSEQREQNLFFKPKLSYFHKGQCVRPDLGVQVSAPEKKAVVKNQLQSQYPNMSILMAKRSEHEAIVKKLRERGIACAIQYKFQQYKFRYLLSAAVLYHKLRFDLLLNTIQHKEEFQFAGKYTIILKVTEFIKLVERNAYCILPEIDFKYYQDYFNKEYPNERPILWKYNTGSETEFYCQAGSKSKNLFLYCIMNENNERVAFKNPKNYDKLTPADINDRFSLYFPVDLAGAEGQLKAALKGMEKR